MAEVRADQTIVKKLISDIIALVCKQSLRYSSSLQVQGLIAVTIDNCETFVVQMDVTTTKNNNSTNENPVLEGNNKRSIINSDNFRKLLTIVDLTEEEEPGSANTCVRGAPSRNLFVQPVSQVDVASQTSHAQLPSSNCDSLRVPSNVTNGGLRVSGPAQLAPLPVRACQQHIPASDSMIVSDDDKGDIVIFASESEVTKGERTSDKRLLRSTGGITVCRPQIPDAGGKIPSTVSGSSDSCNPDVSGEIPSTYMYAVRSDRCNLNVLETSARHDYHILDQPNSLRTDSIRYHEPLSLDISTLSPASRSEVTSEAKAASSVGLNCFFQDPSIKASAQHKQTGGRQTQLKFYLRSTSGIPDAKTLYKYHPHPFVTTDESALKTYPEVYTDVAEDRCTWSNDSRQSMITDEYDEMQKSVQYFRPFWCKFVGCVASYVDASQLATHYSVTHTKSLDLRLHLVPYSSDPPELKRSASRRVQSGAVKRGFLCPVTGCEFTDKLFSNISEHHKAVHLKPIHRKIKEHMIWRRQNRTCCSPEESTVSELQNSLPEVTATVEFGNRYAPLLQEPSYCCVFNTSEGCQWTANSVDELHSHLQTSHNFVIVSKRIPPSSQKNRH